MYVVMVEFEGFVRSPVSPKPDYRMKKEAHLTLTPRGPKSPIYSLLK